MLFLHTKPSQNLIKSRTFPCRFTFPARNITRPQNITRGGETGSTFLFFEWAASIQRATIMIMIFHLIRLMGTRRVRFEGAFGPALLLLLVAKVASRWHWAMRQANWTSGHLARAACGARVVRVWCSDTGRNTHHISREIVSHAKITWESWEPNISHAKSPGAVRSKAYNSPYDCSQPYDFGSQETIGGRLSAVPKRELLLFQFRWCWSNNSRTREKNAKEAKKARGVLHRTAASRAFEERVCLLRVEIAGHVRYKEATSAKTLLSDASRRDRLNELTKIGSAGSKIGSHAGETAENGLQLGTFVRPS